MSRSEPTLDGFGALLMEQVRDLAIREIDALVSRRESMPNSDFARKIHDLLASFDTQQFEALHRLVPIIVDMTLHDLLWMLEQWDSVTVGIQTVNGTVPDIR